MAKNKIFVIYAGSIAEREDLDDVSQQVRSCLDDLGYISEVICAYDYPPAAWNLSDISAGLVILLDPYYEVNGRVFDLRRQFDVQKITYTGPGYFASTKTADKVECKIFLNDGIIAMIPNKICHSLDDFRDFIRNNTSNAFVVKPVDRGGGLDVYHIERANIDEEIPPLLLSKYGKFLIEKYIPGQEISISVIQRPFDGKIITFPPVSIVLKGYTIFNAEAKKDPNSRIITIPAKIDSDQKGKLLNFSTRAYNLLNFSGLLRVDFLECNGDLFFLEANSYPTLGRNHGLSVPSAKTLGYDQKEIIKWLIDTATKDVSY